MLQVVLGCLEFVPGGVCFFLVVFSVSLGCLENCLELFLLVVVCTHVFQIVCRCFTLFWVVLGRVGLHFSVNCVWLFWVVLCLVVLFSTVFGCFALFDLVFLCPIGSCFKLFYGFSLPKMFVCF